MPGEETCLSPHIELLLKEKKVLLHTKVKLFFMKYFSRHGSVNKIFVSVEPRVYDSDQNARSGQKQSDFLDKSS